MTGASGLHQTSRPAYLGYVQECTTIRLCWCRAAMSQVIAAALEHVSLQAVVTS